MARILYGVLGQGLGHATRAHTIADGLLARGHDVHFITSAQATRYLSQQYPQRVNDVYGLRIEFRDSHVDVLRTIWGNLRDGVPRLPQTRRLVNRLFQQLRPELVITDFEPFSAFWAKRWGVRLISLDNEHLLTHCRLERLPGRALARLEAYLSTRLAFFNARTYLISYFRPMPIAHQLAVVIPPVLRPAVYRATPSMGDYLLAYLSEGMSTAPFCAALESWSAAPVRAYVAGRQGDAGSVSYRPRSVEGFLSDLAGCRAVLTSAGYSLLCECLHLRKPMLIVPAAGQYEQELNAFYMARWGYGMTVPVATPEAISDFWRRVPEFTAQLAEAPRADVECILDRIEDELP